MALSCLFLDTNATEEPRPDFALPAVDDGILKNLVILSFPKSGRTWFNMLLSTAVCASTSGNETRLIGNASEDSGNTTTTLRRLCYTSPFDLTTHGDELHGHPFELHKNEFERYASWFVRVHNNFTQLDNLPHNKVLWSPFIVPVLLVRSPLSVAASTFFYRFHRERFVLKTLSWNPMEPLPNTLEDFVCGDLLSLNSGHGGYHGGLGAYVGFLNAWVSKILPKIPSFMIVHYESLHICPELVLGEVISRLERMELATQNEGVTGQYWLKRNSTWRRIVGSSSIREAIELTRDIRRLQKWVDSNSGNYPWKVNFLSSRASGSDSAFFRSGKMDITQDAEKWGARGQSCAEELVRRYLKPEVARAVGKQAAEAECLRLER